MIDELNDESNFQNLLPKCFLLQIYLKQLLLFFWFWDTGDDKFVCDGEIRQVQ
jgi:hypothetical protein